MNDWKSSRWTLAGAAALLLASASVAQEEKGEEGAEKEKVEKKVYVLQADDVDRRPFVRMLDEDLDCQEQNGRTVCVGGKGLLPHPFFSGTFLGVQLTDATPELREHLGGPEDRGVLVSRVDEESPAAQAGLSVGDIVTAVDGQAIESAHDLRRAISSRDEGDEVSIEVYRDGRAQQLTATLAAREPRDFLKRFELENGKVDAEAISEQVREALASIDFEELNANLRKQLEEVDWEQIREAVNEALDRAIEKEQR